MFIYIYIFISDFGPDWQFVTKPQNHSVSITVCLYLNIIIMYFYTHAFNYFYLFIYLLSNNPRIRKKNVCY